MSHGWSIMGRMDAPLSYRPSVFYYRKALREAETRDRAVVVGLVVCHELEQLKAWVREQGMIPPKWIVDPHEAEEKGWTADNF